MTYQEILEGITRHRTNRMSVNHPSGSVIAAEVQRKIDEIEWALQAIAEKLVAEAQSSKKLSEELRNLK